MNEQGAHTAENDATMRLRGDGVNANRYRANKDNSAVNLYLDVMGQHTVADLLDFIEAQGALPGDVTFRGGCFVITLPSTPEDVRKWEQADADHLERSRRFRRDQYERLRAEFEGEQTSVIPPAENA